MTDLIALLDLTSLGDDDTADDVRALCARAVTPHGPVAAVCVLPAFTGVAVRELAGTGVRVATVANFPDGDDDPFGAADQIAFSIDAGADEVDVVVPWRAHLAGDDEAVGAFVAACAEAAPAGALKAILETGALPGLAVTRAVADAALGAGAAFVKTSTGKAAAGATPEAVRVLCEAVRDAGTGGVKVAGGVRTAEQARAYATIAQDLLGGLDPGRFRIGASGLLDELL